MNGLDVVPVARSAGETLDRLARRAVDGVAVVVNAAGIAHIEHPAREDLDRLQVANVELPVSLALAAAERGVSMVHISSVKAVGGRGQGPYADSKRRGEERLRQEAAARFADVGASLVVVRPLALLLPPLDAGKVARLRFLRWWPRSLTPPLRLPVLSNATFLQTVDRLVTGMLAAEMRPGLSMCEFGSAERGSLRDVQAAFRRTGAEVFG